jgi:hypothetical protein
MTPLEQYKRIERPLNETEVAILNIIQQHQPISVTDVRKKLAESGKEVTLQYVSTLTSRLIDDGVLTYTTGEAGAKLLSIADGVIIEGATAYVPAPVAMTPEDRLSQVLDLFNVKGDIKRKVLNILALNPAAHNPHSLFSILYNLRVEPSTARNIVETYFGAQQYAMMQQQFAFNQPFIQPYPMNPVFPQPIATQPVIIGQQPHPVVAGYTPSGQPIIIMQPPPQPQPQQPPQIQVIKTGETRRIRRVRRNEKGEIVKLPDGTPEYEEIEEPVTLTVGGGESALTSVLAPILEKVILGKGEKSEAEKEAEQLREKLQEEKEKRLEEKIAEIEKKNMENIQSLLNTFQKGMQDVANSFKDSLEKLQHSWEDRFREYEHKLEIERIKAESSAGERPLVSIVKTVDRTLRELPQNIAAAVQTIYRPAAVPAIPQMTPEQMAADAKKLKEQLGV